MRIGQSISSSKSLIGFHLKAIFTLDPFCTNTRTSQQKSHQEAFKEGCFCCRFLLSLCSKFLLCFDICAFSKFLNQFKIFHQVGNFHISTVSTCFTLGMFFEEFIISEFQSHRGVCPFIVIIFSFSNCTSFEELYF